MNDPEIRELLAPKLAHYVCTLGELTIGNQTGDMTRADVVGFTADAMHGFEIKGDGDTLKRIPLQLACYQRTFSRVTFVVTMKHLKKLLPMLPPGTGVWVAEEDGVHEWLPAMRHNKQEKAWLLGLLWVEELKELGKRYGVLTKGKHYAHERVAALADCPALTTEALECFVAGCLQGRMAQKAAQRVAGRAIREREKEYKREQAEHHQRLVDAYVQQYGALPPDW